ncbi:hypothetical protein CHS0354_024454, partial [Potamilus streckersoni]
MAISTQVSQTEQMLCAFVKIVKIPTRFGLQRNYEEGTRRMNGYIDNRYGESNKNKNRIGNCSRVRDSQCRVDT